MSVKLDVVCMGTAGRLPGWGHYSQKTRKKEKIRLFFLTCHNCWKILVNVAFDFFTASPMIHSFLGASCIGNIGND